MAQPTTPSGFFHDLFTPLPESEQPKKDPLDHVAEYAESATGSWDLFRVGNHLLSAVELYLTPAHKFGETAGKVKEVFNTAGIGLSIPQFVSDLNSLRHSISNWFTLQDLPYSDPLRTRKIAHAAKKSFLDSMTLTNTVAQIALFVDNAKVFLFEAAHLRIIDGVYNVTSVITDGAEFVGECFKLKEYHSPEAQPHSPAEADKLEEKKTLAWITIAKAVASVASGVIALGVIVFGVAASSVAIVSTAILGISAFWLTMKITAHFYKKVIVEASVPPQTNLAVV